MPPMITNAVSASITIRAPVHPFLFEQIASYVLYAAGAWIGLQLYAVHTFAAPIWPATGIAIALVYLTGYRVWPAIFVGALSVNLASGAELLPGLAIATGNTLEAVFAVYILKRYLDFNPLFARLRDAIAFITVCVAVPFVSATLGTGALLLSGGIPTGAFEEAWAAWWIGDAIGGIVVGAFGIRQFIRKPAPITPIGIANVISAFALLILSCMLAFWSPEQHLTRIPMFYFFLPLTWIAIGLRFRSITSAILIIAATGSIGTLLGYGIFGDGEITERIFVLQAFIGTMAAIYFCFTAIVEERRQAFRKLEGKLGSMEETLTRSRIEEKAKNEFIAMLAHELRNPLAPILSTLELLKIKRKGDDDHHAVVQAEEQAHMMRRLLDDLLDISRITKQKLKLHKDVIMLQDPLDRSLHAVKSIMATYGHDLRVSIRNKPLWGKGDPLRLAQIFGNILFNAAKYTPPGGVIELTASQAKDEAVVSVKDNGVGIRRESLERIFEPFVSIETPLSHVGTGLGIGLALTKSLVEMHGGSIDAKSAGSGTGSTFTVRIPLTDPPKDAPRPEILPQKTLFPFRILIVDDNAAAAEGLQKLLTLRGHDVMVAHDGKTALASTPFNPDIVLLDIGLPDQSGHDVAAALKSNPDFHGILVAVSGYGQPDDLKRAKEAGFDHHCTKPVSLAELERVFDTLIEKKNSPKRGR